MKVGKFLSRALHSGGRLVHAAHKHLSSSAHSAYLGRSKKTLLHHLEGRKHSHPDQVKKGHQHSPAVRAVLRHTSQASRSKSQPQNLSPAQKQQVSHAIGEIRQNTQTIEKITQPRSPSQGPVIQASPGAATLKSTEILKKELQGKDPQVQQAILRQVQPDIGVVAQNFSQLSEVDAKKAFSNLSAATESLGQDHASLLSDAFAKHYPLTEEDRGDAPLRRFPTPFEKRQQDLLNTGAKKSIESGKGALFSVALTSSLEKVGKTHAAQSLRDQVLDSLETVQKNYKSDRENFEKREAQLAITIANNPQYTEAQKEAGIENFRHDHAKDYHVYNQSSKIFASTLSGTAALESAYEDTSAQYPFNPHQKNQTNLRIDYVLESGMQEVASLSQSETGRQALGQALLKEARGEETFLQKAAQQVSGDTKMQNDFDRAMLRTAGLEGEKLVKQGKGEEVPRLLEGAGEITHNKELKKAFSEYAESLEKFSSEDFAAGLVNGADIAKLAQESIQDKKLSKDLKNGFKLIGVSLGSAGLAVDVANTIDDPNLENSLRTVVDAAGLSEAFLSKGLASNIAGKVNIVGQVGFSIWDTYSAIQNGDKLGAASSSLPLLLGGAGLAFGPEGGAAGLVIGSAADFVIDVGRAVFGKDSIEEFEKETQSFHEAALQKMGFGQERAEELAYRLRDVNKDLQGAGVLFADAAKVSGLSSQDWFKQVATLPDDDLHDLMKLSLKFAKGREEDSKNLQTLQAQFLDKEMKYYQEHGKFSDEFDYARKHSVSEQLLYRWAVCY